MCYKLTHASPNFPMTQQGILYYLYFTYEELVAQGIKRNYLEPYKGKAGSRNLVFLTLNVVTLSFCRPCAARRVGTLKSSPKHELVD